MVGANVNQLFPSKKKKKNVNQLFVKGWWLGAHLLSVPSIYSSWKKRSHIAVDMKV
jgi:hypothetical protein